jgi:hypothetical protein
VELPVAGRKAKQIRPSGRQRCEEDAVTPWSDRVEDDGAGDASERALQQRAEGLVTTALKALGRAFSSEDQVHQLRAELLLEVARAMRTDARRGSWTVLPADERRQLRDALVVLERLADSGVPLPVA